MTAQRPLGFWVALVDRLIEDMFAVTLEEHGVTRTQWQLLNLLGQGPTPTAQLDTAIAPFLRAEGESSAEHLTELIDSDWVVSTASGYELTEKGSGAFLRLSQVVEQQRARVSDGVPAEDYERTVTTLERMARNLGWDEA